MTFMIMISGVRAWNIGAYVAYASENWTAAKFRLSAWKWNKEKAPRAEKMRYAQRTTRILVLPDFFGHAVFII